MANEIVKKPGYKTSEFWITAIGTLVTLVMSSGAITDGSQADRIAGYIVAGLAMLGYTVSRTKAKQ